MPTPLDPASEQPRRPTLRTLAEHTGLHISTISRALRLAPDASPTAALAHATAERLGYRRDPLAASLRSRRSGAIGLVVPSLTDLAGATAYEQVDRVAREHGYDVVLATTGDDPRAQRRRVELLLERRVDGLLIADAHRDGDYATWVASLGVPYTLLLRRAPGHPAFTCDDHAAGRLLAEHLVRQGHRTVGLITGPDYSAVSHDRAAAFTATLAEHGVAVADELITPGGLLAATGADAMRRLRTDEPDLTAVYCAGTDAATLGAFRTLHAAGGRPASPLAVVGHADAATSEALGLTTTTTPTADLGQLAAAALMGAIDGTPPTGEQRQPRLAVRASSATPAAGLRALEPMR